MDEIRKSSLEKKQEFNHYHGALLELRQKEKLAYKEVEKCKVCNLIYFDVSNHIYLLCNTV